jgi:hypothetical protein
MGVVIEGLEERALCSAWYVTPQGRDSWRGTRGRPFASIQHAADMARPGDTVYIKSGVYHETVTPRTSGTAAKPITFRPYGSGRVTIDGGDVVSGLAQTSPGIYSGMAGGSLGEGNDQFYVGGVALNEASWPATGPNSSSGMTLPATAVATGATVGATLNGIATATLTVPNLQDPVGAWVGATIHIAQGQQWVFQTGTVIASAPGVLTYSYTPLTPYSFQKPQAGSQFYLTGSATAFNYGGQWYLDPTTGQLSLRYTGATPPVVEMKHRLYAFDLSGDSYIRIQNINLTGCTINTNANSSNLTLTGLSARYVSQATNAPNPWDDQYHPHTTGIILNGTHNLLASSVIAFSSGDGVFLGGSNNTVQNCIIHDVDTDGADEAGVTSIGSNNQILQNTIYNCSRSGVVIRYSPGVSVLNNRIYLCGLQTTDLGGVYTFGTDGQGSRIAYNVISDVRTGGFGGVGVYLDNGSSNYIVDHNVVWNADAGAKLNPPDIAIQVYNNTLIGVTYSVATSGGPTSASDAFINNILIGMSQMGAAALQSNNLLNPAGDVFVNEAKNAYQLKKKSSAIDAGEIVGGYTRVFKGKAPDIGAYEFGLKPFTAGATIRLPRGG